MGWAQRANPTAQDKRKGLIQPKPSKAREERIHSRDVLMAGILAQFGIGSKRRRVLKERVVWVD